MLKKTNHKIVVLMIIAFSLTIVLPLLAPIPAAASSSYSVIRTETVSAINTYLTYPMIQVDIPNSDALSANDLFTVSLPAGLEMDNTPNPASGIWDSVRVTYSSAATENAHAIGFEVAVDADGNDSSTNGVTYNAAAGTAPNHKANVKVYAPAVAGSTSNALNVDNSTANVWQAYAIGKSFIEIKVINPALFKAGTTHGRLYICLQSVKVTKTFAGDINANIATPSNTGFTNGNVTVARWASGGKGTVTWVNSVTTMGTAPTTMDTIVIQETVQNSLANGQIIQFKLPAGFKWISAGNATAAWGFNGLTFTAAIDAADSSGRTLNISCPANGLGSLVSEGRIYLDGTVISVVNETTAPQGPVSIHVSGTHVTTQEIIMAHYADYRVTVAEKTIAEVVAGRDDTELGSFSINESIAGSLIPNRTVTLTLPAGVKWDDTHYVVGPAANLTTVFRVNVHSGIDWARSVAASASLDAGKRVLKIVLPPTAFTRSSLDIEALKVKISPDYTGDITVDVGGSAGAAGKVKVAAVKAPITLETAAPVRLVMGIQAQSIGDIEIIENQKDTIQAGLSIIQMDLPKGVCFAETPVAAIMAGDIQVNQVSTVAGRRSVQISFKNTSTIAARIRLSNLKLTLDRTVPDGHIKLTVNATASSALTNQAAVFNVDTVAEVVIGQCIPADGVIVGRFKIDSNIYEVNGAARVMDTTPYIIAGRSYVPVRYLAYMLGVADSNIVWDATAQKVTLTKDEKKVELTIGSNIMVINGELQVMEAAPRISQGRTMLPARYVAEGLGYTVTWDEASRSVVISTFS